jgi:Tol biopolymer transport system component
MSRARWIGACLGALTVLASLPGAGTTAPVAFPGKNGLIAFQSFRDGFSQIYVMTDAPTQPTKVAGQRASCYALPVWSRDGRRVAYEFNPDRAGRPSRNSDVFVMNADGTKPTNLTRSPGFDGDASWSPDGRYIVFESQRDGDSEIFTIDLRTRKVRQLTTNRVADEDPAWSPGGRQIAFTSDRDGNREIYLMNPDGSRPLNITRNPASDRNPNWSPNGEFVAFDSDRDGNLEIYKTNDRFLLRRLTNNPGLDALPAWSPDGRSIAFVSERFEFRNRDLFVMRSDGSFVRRLTESTAWDVAPDWGSVQPGTIGKPPAAPPPTPPRGDATSAVACLAS